MRREARALVVVLAVAACSAEELPTEVWSTVDQGVLGRHSTALAVGEEVSSRRTPLDSEHVFGDGISFQNLTVWPIHAEGEREVGEFVTLVEAARLGLVALHEARSATVNSIEIENLASVPILACAGTMVKGGKQDRQIAHDTVIPVGERAKVRAFCVERRRWQNDRGGVGTDGAFDASDWMAAKRVRVAAQYDGDQRGVWKQAQSLTKVVFRELKEPAPGTSTGSFGSQYYLASTRDRPRTGTLFNAQEHEDEATELTRRQMASVVKIHLAAAGNRLVGFAYAVDGEPVSVRTFANRDLLLSHLDAFVNTMCFESEIAQRCDRRAGREIYSRPASLQAVLAMVAGIRAAGLGTVVDETAQRLEQRSNGFGGNSVCSVLTQEGQWVELTQDWTATVDYGDEALEVLGGLQALGYTR